MHFVVPAPGARVLGVVLPIALGLVSWGCSPQSGSKPPEDSLTAGRITVVCVPDARALMEREGRAFSALYPDAVIELRTGTSRDAVSGLFAANADLAVIARELEPEERGAAANAGLDLQGYRFARDAVVLLVHPDNPVENISRQDLVDIYRGDMKNWNAMGGADAAIVPVVQPQETDLSLFLRETLLEGEAPSVQALTAAGDSAVVERVTGDVNAIGYVSLSGAELGAKPLRVAALTGLSYWKPDPEAVYKGDYPLTRFQNFFVRADGARLAHGFITFVTSAAGQRLVHEAGLVPTTVPVRFVRRSPMKGAHEK